MAPFLQRHTGIKPVAQGFSPADFEQYKPKKKDISYHEITKDRNHKKTMTIFVFFRFRVFLIASIY